MVKQIHEVSISPKAFSELYTHKALGPKLRKLIRKAGDNYFGDGKTGRRRFEYPLREDAEALEALKKKV